jgi:hypothetical protein
MSTKAAMRIALEKTAELTDNHLAENLDYQLSFRLSDCPRETIFGGVRW